ncbi:MAG TPA: hypothetical protein VE955_02920 [Candidatus Dormibacteraeota bacterium]|nr:hypothetical protein [Candidatus Dormibacteraeota bacterium]
MQTHQHDVVYYGVVNLVHDSYIIGAVDVWRCRSCDQLFCEDKRYGVTDLAPEVGLPKIVPDTKWAALICTRDKGSNWTLVQTAPGLTIAHSCTPDTKLELSVGQGYDLEHGPASGIGQHRLILIDKFVNSAVDVQSGKPHTTTTNAYQALGKPFSYTPPLSAAVIEPSRYNILNLTSILLIATAIWSLIIAVAAPGIPSNISTTVRTLFSLVGLGTLAGIYFLTKRRIWAPLVGAATAAIGLVAYLISLSPYGYGIADYALAVLLAADILTGWLARQRIKGMIERQWHPLDMPAYG